MGLLEPHGRHHGACRQAHRLDHPYTDELGALSRRLPRHPLPSHAVRWGRVRAAGERALSKNRTRLHPCSPWPLPVAGEKGRRGRWLTRVATGLKWRKVLRSSAPTTGGMFILSASVSLPSTPYALGTVKKPGPPIGNGAVVLRRGQYRSPGDWRRLPAFAALARRTQ